MSDENSQFAPVTVEDEILRKGFLAVPMSMIDEKKVGPGAMVTYGVMYYYYVRYHGFPGQSVIAERIGISDRCVRDHVAELKAAGYIDMIRQGLGKKSRLVFKTLYGRECMSPEESAPPSGSTVPTRQDQQDLRLYRIESLEEEEENTCADTCGAASSTASPDEDEQPSTEGKQRKLSFTQQAIQDAYNAFPLEGIATDPPGAKRKQYSRLPQKVAEKGLPLLKEWTEWLKSNPQDVPEGADPWTYFCGRFVAALTRTWEWQGKTGGCNSFQPAASPTPATTEPQSLEEKLKAEYTKLNGPPPKEDTEDNPFAQAIWWGNLRTYQQRHGAELVIKRNRYAGMRPAEVRAKYGDDEWEWVIRSAD